jgi:hypothetical protein
VPIQVTNHRDPAVPRPKLDVERVMLFEPSTEWTYSHHPFLAHFGGRYVAMWSNGREDEDAPGQRVLMATSPDFVTWTKPAPLVDVTMGERTELVMTSAGFHHHHHHGRLIAYVGEYEYDPAVLVDGRRPRMSAGHRNTRLWATTTTDLAAWCDPVDLGLAMVPNYGPEPTASGRLIISGNVALPHTDDPSGLAGWTMAGVYPPELADGLVDDSETFHGISKHAGWPVPLCETSWFQTDDGVIHALFRSRTSRLWLSESTDDGATWSEPVATDFSNGVSKFQFGRLPDGRFFCVCNPDHGSPSQRNPLTVELSDDGSRFDRSLVLGDEPFAAKRPGLHKGGDYGYPHALIRDGHLHVIYSRQKEAIEAVRVPLSRLT